MENLCHTDVTALPIERLNLSARASNFCKKLNIVYVGDLVQYMPRELMRFPNMGAKSVKNIEDALASYGLRLGMKDTDVISVDADGKFNSLDKFISVMNVIRERGIATSKEMIEMTPDNLLDITGIGEENLHIIQYGLDKWGMRLGSVVPKPVDQTVRIENTKTFREELFGIVKIVLENVRENQFLSFAARHGIDDGPPLTLEEIGARANDYGFEGSVTRARVHQIINKAEKNLRNRAADVRFNHWESSIQEALQNLPTPTRSFVPIFGFQSNEESSRLFHNIKLISEIFDLEFPFEIIDTGKPFVVAIHEKPLIEEALFNLSHVRCGTYVDVEEVVRRLNCDRHILEKSVYMHSKWEFIDCENNYLWKKPTADLTNAGSLRNSILICLCKIFSLTKEARSSDLVQSIPRHRLIRRDIPVTVLEGIARKSGIFDVRDDKIVRRDQEPLNFIGKKDSELARICTEYGQTVSSNLIYSSLIRQGMTQQIAAITVAHSPLLIHTQSGVGRKEGIYKFVFRPKDIEINVKREEEKKNSDGEISSRLRIPISARVQRSGRYYATERIGLDGEWMVYDPHGSYIGNITISDKLVSGLAPVVHALMLEKDQFLELEKSNNDRVFIASNSR